MTLCWATACEPSVPASVPEQHQPDLECQHQDGNRSQALLGSPAPAAAFKLLMESHCMVLCWLLLASPLCEQVNDKETQRDPEHEHQVALLLWVIKDLQDHL